jgi:hypothetical protein
MKKDSLRKKLFENAWHIVANEGIEKLNARKLATSSNCALGSIYTIYDNFQELELNINAKIISMLYAHLNHALDQSLNDKQSIKEVFKQLGSAYLKFGQENLFLWKSLFEHLPIDKAPDWYVLHTKEGIYTMCKKISNHFAIDETLVRQTLGFFWSSVHGVSSILLNKKMKMVSELFNNENIDLYINCCLNGFLNESEKLQLV